MTNKINDIDVSECEFFEKQHIEDMYESDDCNVCIDNFCALCWKECEKHNGCYFKQLKRLQEENEKLKNKNNDLIEVIASGNIDIAILQKENEELKKYYGGFVANCRYCDEWYMDKCNYIKKDNKYKQALEEIREKCLKMCNICDNIDGETYLDDCNAICEYCKIIDLINEVIK